MTEDEKYITQHHPDGSKTTIPKHLYKDVVEVHTKDWTSRALAVGGMIAGAGALVFEATRAVVEPKQEVSPRIVRTVEAIQTRQYQNEMKACIDENILKTVAGFEMGSMEDCEDEREYVATLAADRPNLLFPGTPTPIP